MTNLANAIWFEVHFLRDMLGEDIHRVFSTAVRRKWLRNLNTVHSDKARFPN